MLLSKCLNIIAGIIMYGCVIVLTVGLIFNFAMHEVIGTKLYTLEAASIFVVCIGLATLISNFSDRYELSKFHEYCDKNDIPPTIDNYNIYLFEKSDLRKKVEQ